VIEGLGLAILLLPLGVALGWYVARLSVQPEDQPGRPVPNDYLAGLQFLADDDPDQAIAALMRAVEVDSETAELHLTLGRLFRRRGEVDRALRIHQNILTREGLPARQVNQARFELARDYQAAGLLDRAEVLYRELVDEGMFLEDGLAALQGIHEQTRDWEKAIDVAAQLASVRGQSLQPLIAHYHCELADRARMADDTATAIAHAVEALRADGKCVRASLLLGDIHEKAGDRKAALRAYERVPEQNIRFFAHVLPMLRRVNSGGGHLENYARYLNDAEQHYRSPQPTLARIRLMREAGMDPTEALLELTRAQPTWSALQLLAETHADESPVFEALHQGLDRAAESMPPYRCNECGLTPRLLFWQCPSCKHWGSIEPRADEIPLNQRT
jgi:lipopolysaccharide biosynthesis regulator YciM